MLPIFVLVALVLATGLYLMLIRRRSGVRIGHRVLARALAESSDIAVARIREATGRKAAELAGAEDRREVLTLDRRTGRERRAAHDRRRGRGRRTGADRRRGWFRPRSLA